MTNSKMRPGIHIEYLIATASLTLDLLPWKLTNLVSCHINLMGFYSLENVSRGHLEDAKNSLLIAS